MMNDIKTGWNGRNKQRSRQTPYIRRCRRCSDIFKTFIKGGKICKLCRKSTNKNYKARWGNKC